MTLVTRDTWIASKRELLHLKWCPLWQNKVRSSSFSVMATDSFMM